MGIPDTIRYDLPDLPANTVDWVPDPTRAVLLVHDMQGYFLRPFPPDVQPGRALRHHAARLRARCAELGVPVAYTAQPGAMTALQRGLLADFWGPGMTAAPQHRRVDPALAPAVGDWVFTKWRYSAFHRTDLLDRIRAAGRDQLIICGVYAHVGVLATACDAFSHDIETFVAADAVADFTAEDHRMALTYAANRCAVVASTDTLLAALPTVTAPAGV